MYVQLSFVPVSEPSQATIAILTLNRPAKMNALFPPLYRQLASHLETVAKRKDCRALILSAHGDHFCAGADLEWMHDSHKLSTAENIAEVEELVAMYDRLLNFPLPTICITQGVVYGGGLALMSACDIVIAQEGSRFSLSEVRIGLFPAILIPYVGRRMAPGPLRRFAVTGSEITQFEAHQYGLVDHLAHPSDVDAILTRELDAILKGSPEAQGKFKVLFGKVFEDGFKQTSMTIGAFAQARVEGKESLARFLKRQIQPWVQKTAKMISTKNNKSLAKSRAS